MELVVFDDDDELVLVVIPVELRLIVEIIVVVELVLDPLDTVTGVSVIGSCASAPLNLWLAVVREARTTEVVNLPEQGGAKG